MSLATGITPAAMYSISSKRQKRARGGTGGYQDGDTDDEQADDVANYGCRRPTQQDDRSFVLEPVHSWVDQSVENAISYTGRGTSIRNDSDGMYDFMLQKWTGMGYDAKRDKSRQPVMVPLPDPSRSSSAQQVGGGFVFDEDDYYKVKPSMENFDVMRMQQYTKDPVRFDPIPDGGDNFTGWQREDKTGITNDGILGTRLPGAQHHPQSDTRALVRGVGNNVINEARAQATRDHFPGTDAAMRTKIKKRQNGSVVTDARTQATREQFTGTDASARTKIKQRENGAVVSDISGARASESVGQSSMQERMILTHMDARKNQNDQQAIVGMGSQRAERGAGGAAGAMEHTMVIRPASVVKRHKISHTETLPGQMPGARGGTEHAAVISSDSVKQTQGVIQTQPQAIQMGHQQGNTSENSMIVSGASRPRAVPRSGMAGLPHSGQQGLNNQVGVVSASRDVERTHTRSQLPDHGLGQMSYRRDHAGELSILTNPTRPSTHTAPVVPMPQTAQRQHAAQYELTTTHVPVRDNVSAAPMVGLAQPPHRPTGQHDLTATVISTKENNVHHSSMAGLGQVQHTQSGFESAISVHAQNTKSSLGVVTGLQNMPAQQQQGIASVGVLTNAGDENKALSRSHQTMSALPQPNSRIHQSEPGLQTPSSKQQGSVQNTAGLGQSGFQAHQVNPGVQTTQRRDQAGESTVALLPQPGSSANTQPGLQTGKGRAARNSNFQTEAVGTQASGAQGYTAMGAVTKEGPEQTVVTPHLTSGGNNHSTSSVFVMPKNIQMRAPRRQPVAPSLIRSNAQGSYRALSSEPGALVRAQSVRSGSCALTPAYGPPASADVLDMPRTCTMAPDPDYIAHNRKGK